MSTITTNHTTTGGLELRMLREGYGEGAWHGPDLKAALVDVSSNAAFWRPAPGRGCARSRASRWRGDSSRRLR